MKQIITIVALILIVGGFFYLASNSKEVSDANLVQYTDEELGVVFTYNDGEDGYTILEPDGSGNESDDYVKRIVLMRTDDYEIIKDSPGQGGPPTINITAFTNSNEQTLADWLLERQSFTNFEENNTKKVIVGGVEGLRYTWEGMFNGETVAFLYNGNVYLVEGTFHGGSEDDGRKKDFSTIIATFSFTY